MASFGFCPGHSFYTVTGNKRRKKGTSPSLSSLSAQLFRFFPSLFPICIWVFAHLFSFALFLVGSFSSLLNMMKKSRRVLMESSPSSSALFQVPIRQEAGVRFQPWITSNVGDGARARFKLQTLSQDYEELLKETEEKEKKLQDMKQKKRQLAAEVKFLRRKYASFARNPIEETTYGMVKRQSSGMLSPSVRTTRLCNTKQTSREETVVSMTSGLLDLNQSTEEVQEFPMEWECLKVDNSRSFLMDGAAMASDSKTSLIRDVDNASSKVARRKTSWQDQVALRA